MYKIYNGDCLSIFKDIEDKSVNLVLIDPPYNIGKDKKWDKWETVNEYVEFMGKVFKECQRVLKDNGSFYFFHNDFLQMVELQNYINKNTNFRFNSFIVWDKGDFRALSWKNPSEKNNLRSWFNTCEYCLYYTFKDRTGLVEVMTDVNNFKPLREYFEYIQKTLKTTKTHIIQQIGQNADHCFRWGSSQWDLPTEETYNQLINTFKINDFEGFRTYESLREEYESLREEYEPLREEYESLRPVHNLDKNHNNIWRSSIRNSGKLHPCEKPLDILERIIRTSTHEGGVVLDCFMGSGSTGAACVNANRNFIGMELDPNYFNIAKQRIEEACK